KKFSRCVNVSARPESFTSTWSEYHVYGWLSQPATGTGTPLWVTGSGSIMMCIFVLVDGSVGTGTPGCAFGGGPGGHGSGGVFGGYTTGGVSASVPSGPAGSTSMSTNSVGDCAM